MMKASTIAVLSTVLMSGIASGQSCDSYAPKEGKKSYEEAYAKYEKTVKDYMKANPGTSISLPHKSSEYYAWVDDNKALRLNYATDLFERTGGKALLVPGGMCATGSHCMDQVYITGEGGSRKEDINTAYFQGFCDGIPYLENRIAKLVDPAKIICEPFQFLSAKIDGDNLQLEFKDDAEGCTYTLTDDDGMATLSSVFLGMKQEILARNHSDKNVHTDLNGYSSILKKSMNLLETYTSKAAAEEKAHLNAEIAAIKPLVNKIANEGKVTVQDFEKLGAEIQKAQPNHGYDRIRRCLGVRGTQKRTGLDQFMLSLEGKPATYNLTAGAEACPMKIDSSKLTYEGKSITNAGGQKTKSGSNQ